MVQREADGTGGALRAALEVIDGSETVLVLSGDHPLVSAEIIAGLRPRPTVRPARARP